MAQSPGSLVKCSGPHIPVSEACLHHLRGLGQMVISLNISFLICKVDGKLVSACRYMKVRKNANIIGHLLR